MKLKDKHRSVETSVKPATNSENFFRELEIQFLVHELKGPMAVIETGLSTLLKRKEKYGPISAKQERVLTRALRNSQKVRAMLNDLLEIGGCESGNFCAVRFQPVKAVYAALLASLEIAAPQIFYHIDPGAAEDELNSFLSANGIFFSIDPQVSAAEIHQDEIRFRQIVGNLFKNALHHRKERLDIKMHLESKKIWVSVKDDGPGVDPAQHELIFRRYAQADVCAPTLRSGHGLGLAAARIIARCLGGDITISSQKGHGAEFRLYLPVVWQDV